MARTAERGRPDASAPPVASFPQRRPVNLPSFGCLAERIDSRAGFSRDFQARDLDGGGLPLGR